MRHRRVPLLGFADIFEPKAWELLDELCHQRDASLVLQHLDHDAAAPQKFFFAHEILILANDHFRNSIQ